MYPTVHHLQNPIDTSMQNQSSIQFGSKILFLFVLYISIRFMIHRYSHLQSSPLLFWQGKLQHSKFGKSYLCLTFGPFIDKCLLKSMGCSEYPPSTAEHRNFVQVWCMAP
jgi:hypothetical protein